MSRLTDISDRILLVDDEEEIRKIISKVLIHLGYDVVTANNGREGLEFFLDRKFDLVITDFGMPDVDGLTLASSIKKTSPQTPVVLITGSASHATQGGPVDCIIHKPLSLAGLGDTIQGLLGKGSVRGMQKESLFAQTG